METPGAKERASGDKAKFVCFMNDFRLEPHTRSTWRRLLRHFGPTHAQTRSTQPGNEAKTSKALTRLKHQRESAGGPREGSGGAVTHAMCAAADGSSAWASALGAGCVSAVFNAGGAESVAHKGQSSVWLVAATSESSP